jgi:putative N6-adenine-specific DNA methylase
MELNHFKFFISGPLGCESFLRQEVLEVLPFCLDASAHLYTGDPEVEIQTGGVQVELPLIVGLQLNHWLKTAHRVLLRLSEFEAKSLQRWLEKTKNSIDQSQTWGELERSVQIDSSQCELNNEKYLYEKIEKNSKLQAGKGPFYLRGFKDRWTLSLDTSGEHLHKRGVRTWVGEAPLRETWAAQTLRWLMMGETRSSLSHVHLLDPMAGSGVFLSEAAQLYSPSTQREFRYQKWSKRPELLKSPSFWRNLDFINPQKSLFASLVGLEKDAKSFASLEHLAKSANFISLQKDFGDVTRAGLKLDPQARLWVVANPPYGERLKDLSWVPKWTPWLKQINAEKVIFWQPQNFDARSTSGLGVCTNRYSVRNGGLPCEVLHFDLDKNRQMV